MINYSGKTLRTHMANSIDKGLKKRFIASELEKYLAEPNNGKICCLYGLRRTGKTVLMLQQLRKLNMPDQCLLIECEADENAKTYDTMAQIKNEIDRHPECRYIFIDEITKARNFISTCSFLADAYACEGKKIVITGTDSLGFFLAKNDELFDRVEMIHTTYIPYKEYHYLLGKDIMSYIRYGGTLTDGQTIYNNDKLADYTNSAIVYNIMHSLERWNNGRNLGVLSTVIDAGELPAAVNKVLELNNRTFLTSVINKDFQSHDLGSLADLLTKSGEADPSFIDTKEMSDRIRGFLRIPEEMPVHFTDDVTEAIIHYLEKLDLLYRTKGTQDYIFTQPGMRYCQATAMAKALITSEVFDNYTDVEKYRILQKLESDICGRILEDIIFIEIAKIEEPKKAIEVSKYRDIDGKEIDILVYDFDKATTVAIEVKLSDVLLPEKQAKFLTDTEFVKKIENKTGTKISNRVVLYMGESGESPDKNVLYLNVREFLKRPEKYLDALLSETFEAYNELTDTISESQQSDASPSESEPRKELPIL